MNSKSNEEINYLIAQLRHRLKDVIAGNKKFDNDFYLYRWLLQNYLQVDKTEKVILESIEWRKANHVEELANQDITKDYPGLEKIFQVGSGGSTKAGQPITTLITENLNLSNAIQRHGYDKVLCYTNKNFLEQENLMLRHYKHGFSQKSDYKTLCYDYENNGNISCGAGNRSDRAAEGKFGYNPSWFSAAPLLLLSYKNYSFWNVTNVDAIRYNLESTKIQTTYFPAIFSSIYFVNLNKPLNLVLKMIKPLFNTEATKMKFFDTDQTKSQVLLQDIDADQLPCYFGGTRNEEKT